MRKGEGVMTIIQAAVLGITAVALAVQQIFVLTFYYKYRNSVIN